MLGEAFKNFFQTQIVANINSMGPLGIIMTVIDVIIVLFLLYKTFVTLKGTRAIQLVKGIVVLVVITYLSGLFKLTILNYVLTSIMSYGVIMLIIVFQPELRRALEQLGTTNRFSRLLGLDQDVVAKKKENVYKVAIAAVELAKQKKGALIVIERDIKIQDIISTGILMNAEISPQ